MIVGKTTVHPIDFDALNKGDVVDAETIAKAKNIRVTDANYRLAQMAFRQQIEEERPDLYPRCIGQSISILSDQEAEAYNAERFKSHVNGLVRDSGRRVRINKSGFSDAAKRASDSRDLSFSGIAIMAKKQLRRAQRDALLLANPKEVLQIGEGK